MTNLKRFTAALLTAAALSIASGAAMAQEGAKIFVVGGKADDPFWAIVKKGVDDAGMVVAAHGGSTTYLQPQNYDNLGPDAANLVRTAIGQGASAIAVPNWVPEAEDEAIKAAVDAGIAVIMFNAGGPEKAEALGAMNYIGSDEYIAGKAGGEYFTKNGVNKVVCINTIPGSANQEARCKGVIDGVTAGGGSASQLPLPATSFGNPTAVAEAIKAQLLKDNAINGVITISAGDADSAANAIMQAGAPGRVKLGTFDLNQTNLDRIKGGMQLFAIDQQPYLQGFLAVSLLDSHVNYGTVLPTKPVLTGPGIVDASNIDATVAGVKAGAR